jgi:hypothetical protein
MEKTIFNLSIHPAGPNDSTYMVTGFPDAEAIGHNYADAYEFEAAIQKHIPWVNTDPNIEFDSESCQFFVYIEDRSTLDRFIADVYAHFHAAKMKMAAATTMY